MILSDLFDRTYVLNLPHRTDRRGEMEAVLRRAGMGWQDGRLELFPAIRPDSAGAFPSIGCRGSFLSTLAMLKSGRDLGVSRLLVMEDDCDLSPDLPRAVPAIADRLRRDDWGIAYLGHVLDLPDKPGPPGTFQRHDGPIGQTHFYAIHGSVLGRMVAFLEAAGGRPQGHPEGGAMFIDGAFCVFRDLNPDVVTLVAHPNLGWQRSSVSDITSRWFDRNPVTRELVKIPRQAKLKVGRLLRHLRSPNTPARGG